jgi:hypothetical protein
VADLNPVDGSVQIPGEGELGEKAARAAVTFMMSSGKYQYTQFIEDNVLSD